jgi:hypothetical protein
LLDSFFFFLDDDNLILVEGTEQFCAALDVDPTDVVVLVMAWHLKAERMCEFTRDGFVQGWKELGYGHHIDISPPFLPHAKKEMG